VYTVRDTTIDATFDASGVAEPIQRATFGTKLMGSVTEVLVREGDRVGEGQVLARIDGRDLAAKQAQVGASLAEAEAVRQDALSQAARIRGLYADSAATRAQLDAVETGVARAEAGVRAARAASEELGAVTSYTTIRASFAGTVTQRLVDPGAFAAPGTPIVTVEDASRLRVRASAAPDAVRGLQRGDKLSVAIEGVAVKGVVEGVVPSTTGNLYTINAIVDNRDRKFLAGSAATVMLPLGKQTATLVPAAAIRREGDLTGVTIRTATGDETLWIRLGRKFGALVEVGGGLQSGDRIVVPTARSMTASAAPEER
jgi:RND family efflux transporter MFP subunit